ncbi:site-specific integrase [Methylobacterium sp. Leaf466]|uniref:site-specific integrase n=1 Tax=Methylobacterium sp. Leaf466 TaxID=1736386 RepID=UPI0006FE049A|nr:site-specific integrase [Methylobacterium sp. Leaf466]KQT77414.1 integrase [Methylobacterium sp. Leaf466]
MGTIQNVVLRGRIFYFRRRVPNGLRPHLRLSELLRSLATSDPRTAKLRAYRLYLASESLFSALSVTPMLTDDQLARLVQDFYGLILDQESKGRFTRGAVPNDVRKRRVVQFETMAALNREALACNRLEEAGFVASHMLKRQGIAAATLAPEELAQARQAMLRAGIDVAEALKARYEGDFNFEPGDRLLKLQLEARAPKPSSTSHPPATPAAAPEPYAAFQEASPLSVVGAAFRNTQIAIGAWDRQTAAQAGATFRLFTEVCGDQPLAAYSRKDAGRFREQVERLPNDYGKHPRYRGLKVDEILTAYGALTTTDRTAAITQKTVKRHFSALSTLWTAAVAKDEAAANIFAGFRFTSSRKASEQRDMWERAELARLFATPVWTGCMSPTRRTTPGTLIVRDEKFWLPLIAVFSGMRQEEICQLQVEDIRQDEGVWFVDINDRPPRKVKNVTAVRRVPVHSELIRLGFLAHVDKQRRIKQPRVFPGLEPGGADARLGHAFTKWFTRYRRDVGIYRVGLDFHSFRHTATTLMHQAGVATAVIDHITGHATAGETARYTKRSTLPQLQAAIELIAIGVDFSSLHVKAAG